MPYNLYTTAAAKSQHRSSRDVLDSQKTLEPQKVSDIGSISQLCHKDKLEH